MAFGESRREIEALEIGGSAAVGSQGCEGQTKYCTDSALYGRARTVLCRTVLRVVGEAEAQSSAGMVEACREEGDRPVVSGAYSFVWPWECRGGKPVIVGGRPTGFDGLGYAEEEWSLLP